MPTFSYKARDQAGKSVQGVIEAPNIHAVGTRLEERNYFPVHIKEEKPSQPLTGYTRKLGSEDLILFSRQLYTLIRAGIPIMSGLRSLADQSENKRLKSILTDIEKDINEGKSFSDSLAKYPKDFPPLYVNMVRAGETSGTLDVILERLASLIEHEMEMRNEVKAATRYPKIVLGAISIAATVMVTFVVPKFALLYGRFEASLPLPTRMLIGLNHLVHNYWYLGLIFSSLSISLFYWYIRTEKGRFQWDSFKLKVPILGIIFKKAAMSRFAYIFGVLNRSGLPILVTLDMVSATIGNSVVSRIVSSMRKSVQEGRGFSEMLGENDVFPPLVVQMVSIGEESGTLDEMLTKVSEYYDMEVKYSLKHLSTLIEPVLTLFMGVMVLLLALAIFLP
ncbi:MAG: type II secretion system F family protein, partial [Thermodesulfobacteriota bacterium]